MLEQAGECWGCVKSHMACLQVYREAEERLFSAEEAVFSPENHFFHFILIAILFSSTNIVLILIFYSL